MRLISSILLALSLGVLSLGTGRQGRSLDRLRWMAGCWEERRGAKVTVEMWMAPAGNLMLGASRSVTGGVVREWEQLRLSSIGDSLVYHADPSGQVPTDFRGVTPTDSGFVVENLKHDFPQRIIYRKRGTDSLVARIEGPGPSGVKGIDYPMKRVACAAP